MIRRARSNHPRPSLAVCLVAAFATAAVGGAQTHTIPSPRQPNLQPGQSVSGKDHPEFFSRRIALEMILNLLTIDPQDALHSQNRARLIEAKRMQLSTSDAAVLEQAVESYRVKRDALNLRAQALVASAGQTGPQSFASLNTERKALVADTLHQLGQQLSADGRTRISGFVDEVISKSELRATSVGGQK